jgi:hypothetical protein
MLIPLSKKSQSHQGKGARLFQPNPLIFLKAAFGFEPVNNGCAIQKSGL